MGEEVGVVVVDVGEFEPGDAVMEELDARILKKIKV